MIYDCVINHSFRNDTFLVRSSHSLYGRVTCANIIEKNSNHYPSRFWNAIDPMISSNILMPFYY